MGGFSLPSGIPFLRVVVPIDVQINKRLKRYSNSISCLKACPTRDYNVAPTTFQPVISHTKKTSQRELVVMHWGLVPHFAKPLADFKGVATINARPDSLSRL
jgi:putative SOS response-associated peptidase YedK